MNIIQDILQKRSEDCFFNDCEKGAKLNRIFRASQELTVADMSALPHDAVLARVRRLLPPERLERIPPQQWGSRTVLVELAADAVADRRVRKEAHRMDCDHYEHCIFCPEGRRLVAEEIYKYAMGG